MTRLLSPRALAIAALLLGAASIWTYRGTTTRNEGFARGRHFLPNLDPDAVATIKVTKGEGEAAETTTLERDEDRFTVAEADGYRAQNGAVNRLLRGLVDATLEREVGRGPELEAELGLEPPGESGVEIGLSDAAGREMVRLRVGNAFESGHFVERLDRPDEPIYLTSDRLALPTGVDAYLDKDLLDVPATEIRRIDGPDFALERDEEGETLDLLDAPPGTEARSTGLSRARALLQYLRFEAVFPADAPAVADLVFEPRFTVELLDGTTYLLSVAERDDDVYLTLGARPGIERVEFSVEESEEELAEKADRLARADEIQAFAAEHEPWVYEVPSATAEKLRLTRADLVE